MDFDPIKSFSLVLLRILSEVVNLGKIRSMRIFTLCCILALFACGSAQTDQATTNKVEDAKAATVYGAEISPDGAVSLEKLSKLIASQEKVETKVKGEVVGVCQVKGCWMEMAMPQGENMRVKFKDYGFFVPKELLGEVVIEGTAFQETISVDDLRHYAEDAGKSKEEIAAITEPEQSLSFIATGVYVE